MSFYIASDAPLYALPEAQSVAVNAIFGILAALSLLYCLKVAARERKLYPIFFFIGASLSVYYEILTDVLGHCVWATQNQPSIVHALGRDLPLYANFVYMFYFPVALVLINRALDRGATIREWWTWALAGIPFAFLFELYPVHQHWWFYYGAGQPLTFLGLPLYWTFANTMAVMCLGALTQLLRKRVLGDKHSWALMFTIPVTLVCVHMPAVYPVHMALGSTDNLAFTTAGALLTIGVSLAMLAIVGRIVTTSQGGS